MPRLQPARLPPSVSETHPTVVNTRPLVLPLTPLPVARPWGGKRITEQFGWDPGDDRTYGEWWLASTYPGAITAVTNGGTDLARWLDGPGNILGYSAATFPVLLKFLDSEQILSVQVHPSDEVARRQGLPRGKTEAWYILQAAEGAGVYLGTREGVSARDLIERVRAGADDDEVRSLMQRVEVTPGDTLVVEAGTVHAVDAGLAMFEIQQNSDTTYRIHDWGRGRDVHLDQALESVVDHPAVRPIRPHRRRGQWTPLVRGLAFGLWHADAAEELEYAPQAALGLITVLAGRGEIVSGDESTDLQAGDTVLVVGPALLDGHDLQLLATELPT